VKRKTVLCCLIAAFALAAGANSFAAQEEGPPRPLHYRLEVAGSMLRWELPSTFGTVKGTAPAFRGTLDVTPLSSGAWDVRSRIVVPAAGMKTENRRRDRRMRAILETDRYPEIVFELSHFTGDLSARKPGQTFSVEVAGDLTVHGRTAKVQLPVDVYVFADRVELAGSFPLYWKEYGLAHPSIVARVREPMLVVFRLRAVPEKVAGTGPTDLHPPQSNAGTGPTDLHPPQSNAGTGPTGLHPPQPTPGGLLPKTFRR
jgi:polyisoprenoid-binding protein YceI